MKQLYRAKNKNQSTILIVAEDFDEAVSLAIAFNFARKKENLKIEDVTKEYLNKDRQAAGLNFNDFESGQFFQRINGNHSSWGRGNQNLKKFLVRFKYLICYSLQFRL